VPGKEKLVNSIRNSIISEIGIAWFENGFFPLYSEIALYIELYYPTPKSFSRENKYLAEIKMLRKINFPDNDNTEKIIFDSVKSFLIYDDAQIVTNITEKYYSIKPRIQIVIYYNTAEAFYLHKKVIQHRKDMWTRNENFDKLLYKVVKK
jgi:Holliday junction resolvase RusA-like endonuclease